LDIQSLFDDPEASEREGISEDFAVAYFDRVKRLPQLSDDEERELLKRWTKFRDEQARGKIIAANLSIIPPIARKTACKFGFEPWPGAPEASWTGFRELVSDLTAEGNLHLVNAVEHYKEGPFLHYARRCVKNGIVRHAKELRSNVHRPHGVPNPKDAWIDPVDGAITIATAQGPQRVQLVKPPTTNVHEEWASALREVLDYASLTKRETQVIRRRIEGLTLEAIGKDLNISTATAWRVEKRAIDKLGSAHGNYNC
jgi:RNA polymerase sigma factor (sigma-70 family)